MTDWGGQLTRVIKHHSLKRMKNVVSCLSVEMSLDEAFLKSFFNSISSNFHWLVNCGGYYMLKWLMSGILGVVCLVKVNASHVVLCEPYQKFKPSKIDFIILCNLTLKVHFFHLWIFNTVCPSDTKANDINGKGK